MTRIYIHLLVMTSGIAALSWEVIWQIKTALALGVSAWGAAITLAVTMGGMGAGSLLAGYAIRWKTVTRPIRIYGLIEIMIGLCGLFLGAAFRAVEAMDTTIYAQTANASPTVYLLGISAAMGIPAMCMGATIPVLGLVSRQFGTSISLLYGLNTLGAAAGTLLAAFIFIPFFGLTYACWFIASINLIVGLVSWIAGGKNVLSSEVPLAMPLSARVTPVMTYIVVLITGFSTFVLEVSWFRSLKAAFMSTTTAFAIMLSSLLLALGLAGAVAPILKKKKLDLGVLVAIAGVLILLATPVIERFYRFSSSALDTPMTLPAWFLMSFYVIGPPVFFLGIALPWIISDQDTPRKWSVLYAVNTLAAIAGALCAAWIFLPTIGFARTSWLAGILVLGAGLMLVPPRRKIMLGGVGIAAFMVAFLFEAGLGRTTVQGLLNYGSSRLSKVLEFYEGPESTIAAIEYDDGGRALIVDGFITASQLSDNEKVSDHYMAWMGHLPMLLHPDPKNALVICFGTGQTANAVRKENPQSLDIVDINENVLKLAHHFSKNENVLDDPRVKTIIMDGRAYMRRTDKVYDIITLEPMPPNFAGVNALYSKEFYEFTRDRLSDQGIVAQWVPFHLAGSYYMASIVRTFNDVFPNSVLWMDPNASTGIIIGSKDNSVDLGKEWPGYARVQIEREHPADMVKKSVILDRGGVERYGRNGSIITDDNQLLAYGQATQFATPAEREKSMILLQEAQSSH